MTRGTDWRIEINRSLPGEKLEILTVRKRGRFCHTQQPRSRNTPISARTPSGAPVAEQASWPDLSDCTSPACSITSCRAGTHSSRFSPTTANTTPGDWEWSSYRASAGLSTAPPFLDLERVRRAFDATDAVSAQQRFVTFAAVSNDADVSNQVLLIGSEAFAKRCAPHLQRYRDVADFVYAERFAARPALGQLLSRSDRSRERDRAVRTAFCEYAYTLREIGAYLERPIPTIWFWIQRAERARHEGELLKGLTNSVN
jgi:hypothetical protein